MSGVPLNLEVDVNIESLSMSYIPPNYQTTGNVHTGPGYFSSESRVNLTISQTIGLVKVEVESEQYYIIQV